MIEKKSYLKTLFDIPKYEIVIFLVSCCLVITGLAILVTAFTLGLATNWEHAFFKFLGLGSIMTTLGAVGTNINFLLMHIRHHKRFHALENREDKK